MVRVYIALGTNLGDRKVNLLSARDQIHGLEGVTLLAESSILETEPVDFLDQPDFMNQMIEVKTSRDPVMLLEALLDIEEGMGRKRDVLKGPRIIDCDIVLYGSLVMESGFLTIPHPRRLERDFIVRHLVELNPELKDPVTGKLFREYL